jgi:hypothetical protein
LQIHSSTYQLFENVAQFETQHLTHQQRTLAEASPALTPSSSTCAVDSQHGRPRESDADDCRPSAGYARTGRILRRNVSNALAVFVLLERIVRLTSAAQVHGSKQSSGRRDSQGRRRQGHCSRTVQVRIDDELAAPTRLKDGDDYPTHYIQDIVSTILLHYPVQGGASEHGRGYGTSSLGRCWTGRRSWIVEERVLHRRVNEPQSRCRDTWTDADVDDSFCC